MRAFKANGCKIIFWKGRCDFLVTMPNKQKVLIDNKGGQTRSGGLHGDRVVYAGICQAGLDKIKHKYPAYLVSTGMMPPKGKQREKGLKDAIKAGWITGYLSHNDIKHLVKKYS